MAQGFVDRCIYVPASGGTGSFVTSAAVEGYLTPAQANAANATSYRYAAQLLDTTTGLPSEWEVGTGVYTTSTHTLTRVTIEFNSDGTFVAHNFSAAPNIMITMLAADIAGAAQLAVADQTLSGGANVTSATLTTGNITVDCGTCPLQFITNGGNFTITAPSNDGSCMILVTNNASAGTITFSGFSVGANTGDALTTTNTSKFTISVWRINGTSGYRIAAHQ
jgi:hypothetical protein